MKPQVRILIGVAVILLIFFVRFHDALLYPIAGHEDGRDLLTLVFNNGSWRMLFRQYAGYVSVGPNLLAWIASFAPVRWIPHLFTGLALLVAGGAMTAVACDRSGICAPSRLDRFIVAGMLIVLPLGKAHMFTNVTYSQWHMLFLLLLLLVQPFPRTRYGLIGWSMLIAIVSVSNPLSFLGLPLLLLKWRGIRTVMQRSAVVLCGVIMVSYPVWGVQHHQLPVITPASCLFAVRVFLSRVIVESMAGPRLTTALEAYGWGGLTAAAGTVLLAIWFGFRWWFHEQQTGQSKKVDFTAGFQEVVGGGGECISGWWRLRLFSSACICGTRIWQRRRSGPSILWNRTCSAMFMCRS